MKLAIGILSLIQTITLCSSLLGTEHTQSLTKRPQAAIRAHKKEKKNKHGKISKNINQIKRNSPHTLFIVYIAGDNDLFPFAGRNLKQMQAIGSNANVTICAHFDMHRPGQPKISRRYKIEHNRQIQIGPDYSMDSGNIDTLVGACKWAIQSYPAQRYILVLWNHGTGVLEPVIKRAINPSKLFNYNPTNKLIELNRSMSFLDFIDQQNELLDTQVRGICFDDTTGNYLSNHKLKEALRIITTQYMGGKKFDIIGFDACLMSMVEVACAIKDYAHIMVGSQEVELGTGWDYKEVLTPFVTSTPDRVSFAKNIVSSYKKTYGKITNDYSQSAINLEAVSLLERNVDTLSQLLIYGLQNQKNRSLKETLKASRNKNFCTYFDEPTYVDLGHLYANILSNMGKFELTNPSATQQFKHDLSYHLNEGMAIIDKIVIANAVGKNLEAARGISIYFPEYQIHSSYQKADFSISTQWLKFLFTYLSNT